VCGVLVRNGYVFQSTGAEDGEPNRWTVTLPIVSFDGRCSTNLGWTDSL